MVCSDNRLDVPNMMTVKKRSVIVAGHATSVSLEEAFWIALKRLADEEGVGVSALVGRIDSARPGNLSSALRVFVLRELQRKAGW